MEKDPPNLMPAMYSHRIADIQACARICGYAVAIHGSMQRDLDIVAIPWTDDAESHQQLVHRMCMDLGVTKLDGDPKKKPHGRLAYTLLMGGSLFLDLSVMPRKVDGSVRCNNLTTQRRKLKDGKKA